MSGKIIFSSVTTMPLKNINAQVTIDKTSMTEQEKILQAAQPIALLYKWDREEKIKEEKSEK